MIQDLINQTDLVVKCVSFEDEFILNTTKEVNILDYDWLLLHTPTTATNVDVGELIGSYGNQKWLAKKRE